MEPSQPVDPDAKHGTEMEWSKKAQMGRQKTQPKRSNTIAKMIYLVFSCLLWSLWDPPIRIFCIAANTHYNSHGNGKELCVGVNKGPMVQALKNYMAKNSIIYVDIHIC